MKEIKFKIYDRDTGETYYSDIEEQYNKNDYLVCWEFVCGEIVVFLKKYDEIWEVEGEVVQYTGLKDKNGKGIYEGDIVKHKSKLEQWNDILIHEQIGEIKTDKGMTCFQGKTIQTYKNETNVHKSNFIFLSSEIYEIIGNIHDNPELLK